MKKNYNSGFTIVELGLVIIVAGILMLMIISIYSRYYAQMQTEKVDRALDSAKQAVMLYYAAYGHYPCPANATLSPTDANYGRADCSLPVVSGVIQGMFPIYAMAGTTRVNMAELIKATETIQTNYDDPWGHPLTYAVTRSLSAAGSSFNPNLGLIKVVDEYDEDTGGVHNDGHFIILSHGARDCSSPISTEAENCDGDAKFISSIQYRDASNFFDDRIIFHVSRVASLWSAHMDNSWTTIGNAKNDNTGNVGIKTTTPTEKLDVNGTISASSRVRSAQLCDGTSTTCVRPETIYNIDCPIDGQYIKSISVTSSAFTRDCQSLVFEPPAAPVDCSSRGGVRGIYTNGTIVCNY